MRTELKFSVAKNSTTQVNSVQSLYYVQFRAGGQATSSLVSPPPQSNTNPHVMPKLRRFNGLVLRLK